eukprot:TRINITY_DN14160_c0_g1_i1.p1 TRINITY_DN14160_c0_g1~~TRINITY_DN14160_c0_g1_i1.p1  ORF type:complete len:479 (-),score=77.45 TRINITY_DN14160_c0_g1_i1:23-1369(-)
MTASGRRAAVAGGGLRLALLVAALGPLPSAAGAPAKTVPIRIGGQSLLEDQRFGYLRQFWGVSDEDVGALEWKNVPERGDEYFQPVSYAPDTRFILMSIDVPTWNSLHGMLTDYTTHLQIMKGNSFLPRYLSAFHHRGKSWAVMIRMIQPFFTPYSRLYELKASTCDAVNGDRLVRVDLSDPLTWRTTTMLKDLNFAQNEELLHLPKDASEKMLSAMKRDMGFLRSHKATGYSLLVGVMRVGQCDEHSLFRLCYKIPPEASWMDYSITDFQDSYAIGVEDSEKMMYMYSFTIADIHSTSYGMSKKFWCSSSESAVWVDTNTYEYRFREYLPTLMSQTARPLSKQECESTHSSSSFGGESTVRAPLFADGASASSRSLAGATDADYSCNIYHRYQTWRDALQTTDEGYPTAETRWSDDFVYSLASAFFASLVLLFISRKVLEWKVERSR